MAKESVHTGRGMKVGWTVVVSVLFTTCAVNAHVWQQNEVEPDLLPNLDTLSDIYRNGSLSVTSCEVEEGHLGAPKPLLIATPFGTPIRAKYPVIVLQHGYNLDRRFYSQMMSHVASWGFIVVAPQMYSWTLSSDATTEIRAAVTVIDWISDGLPQVLSDSCKVSTQPDLTKVALAGHSRGGKVAFGVATGILGTPSLKLLAIAGLDPVDGTSWGQTKPPILHYKPHDLHLGMPTLIVGSGLGSEPKWPKWLFPPCAPLDLGPAAFYNESDVPAFHFVAPKYGHMDFLNDVTGGFYGGLSYPTCKRNVEEGRDPMRRFSGGILVAFFNAVLNEDKSQFCAALNGTLEAPVKLNKPETYAGTFCPYFLSGLGQGSSG